MCVLLLQDESDEEGEVKDSLNSTPIANRDLRLEIVAKRSARNAGKSPKDVTGTAESGRGGVGGGRAMRDLYLGGPGEGVRGPGGGSGGWNGFEPRSAGVEGDRDRDRDRNMDKERERDAERDLFESRGGVVVEGHRDRDRERDVELRERDRERDVERCRDKDLDAERGGGGRSGLFGVGRGAHADFAGRGEGDVHFMRRDPWQERERGGMRGGGRSGGGGGFMGADNFEGGRSWGWGREGMMERGRDDMGRGGGGGRRSPVEIGRGRGGGVYRGGNERDDLVVREEFDFRRGGGYRGGGRGGMMEREGGRGSPPPVRRMPSPDMRDRGRERERDIHDREAGGVVRGFYSGEGGGGGGRSGGVQCIMQPPASDFRRMSDFERGGGGREFSPRYMGPGGGGARGAGMRDAHMRDGAREMSPRYLQHGPGARGDAPGPGARDFGYDGGRDRERDARERDARMERDRGMMDGPRDGLRGVMEGPRDGVVVRGDLRGDGPRDGVRGEGLRADPARDSRDGGRDSRDGGRDAVRSDGARNARDVARDGGRDGRDTRDLRDARDARECGRDSDIMR
jgi:hypothetical protein